jgi:hypothetical protein
MFAAAGNDANGEENRDAPAMFPGVVSVASLDMYGQQSGFSNYNKKVGWGSDPAAGLPVPVPGGSACRSVCQRVAG